MVLLRSFAFFMSLASPEYINNIQRRGVGRRSLLLARLSAHWLVVLEYYSYSS